MAYLSTFESTAATAASLKKIEGGSLYSDLAGGANVRLGGPQMFSYCSSHSAVDIAVTGFFAGCGAAPLSSTGPLHPNVQARSPNNVGGRVGDAILNIESSGGATPGRATWHGISASTFGGSTSAFSATAGYNLTVAAHAST
jgi:hypothetical protein